jgi:beta-xylosidase
VACTGHADLVEGPDGGDVMVLLGTRSVGSASPLGRETFVTTVEWVDGWPVPAPVALAPRAEPYDEHFDFADDSALSDPGWLGVRRMPRDVTSAQDRAGYLSLRGPSGISEQQPAFIGRRQRHLNSTFEARVNATEGRGGLALRYDEDSAITLLAEPGDAPGTTTVTAQALLPSVTQWTTEVAGDEVSLRLETDGVVRKKAGWSPGGDLIRLVVTDALGVQTQLAELDGRFWSIETAQPFTGRVVGMIAEAGFVRFASFSYHGEGST